MKTLLPRPHELLHFSSNAANLNNHKFLNISKSKRRKQKKKTKIVVQSECALRINRVSGIHLILTIIYGDSETRDQSFESFLQMVT